MHERVLGIDLGSCALRAVAATPDGGSTVSRALPTVLAADRTGRWVVGHAARTELLADPGRVLHRWKSILAPEGSEDAPRQRLGRLLAALRHEIERATGGLAHAAVLAVPTPWTRDRFADLQHAAQMAGLHPDRILPRADALALRLAPPISARVAVLTLDAEGIEASLFDLDPGTVHPLRRSRAEQYTLDAFDDLLFSMMPARASAAARAAATMSVGAWRTALLRGDAAPWDHDDGEAHPHAASLTAAQRTACLEFFSDAAAAQLQAALRAEGRSLDDLDQVVLGDLFGEAEAFRDRLSSRIACRLVRAQVDDTAAGAARFAQGLHAQGRRWVVRESGSAFAAVQANRATPAPAAIAPTPTATTSSLPLTPRAPTAPPSSPPSAPPLPSEPPPLPSERPPPAAASHPPPSSPSAPPPVRSSWLPVSPSTRPVRAVSQPAASEMPPRPMSSLPPRPTSTLPPARPSEAPIALNLSGSFVGTPTAADLLALPQAQPPRSPDEPWSLPLLLLRLERARMSVAVLTLRSGNRTATLHLEGSRPTVHPSERTHVREILGWASGEFEVVPQGRALDPPVVQWSTFGFIVEAMQSVLRSATLQELEQALSPHLHEAPRVAEQKQRVVYRLGLSDREQRMIINELDGGRSLHDLLNGGTASRASLLQLLCLLGAWNALAWTEPPKNEADDPLHRLKAERAKSEASNYLQVLGVHWSVGPQEIADAWKAHQRRYGPGSAAAALSPADAAALLARGEVAYEALRDDLRRVRYVHQTLPNVAFDLLAPLVQGRAMSLSMQRGAAAEFQDAMRLLRELSPELAAETEKIVNKK